MQKKYCFSLLLLPKSYMNYISYVILTKKISPQTSLDEIKRGDYVVKTLLTNNFVASCLYPLSQKELFESISKEFFVSMPP